MKINGKMVTAIAVGVAAVAGIMAATVSRAGGSTDVVKTRSSAAFEEVLTAIPGQVSEEGEQDSWSLTAPDGSAAFVWSKDYSSSPLYDVMIEFDAKPFLEAGLDAGKLPGNYVLDGEKLIVGQKLGNEKADGGTEATALDAFQAIPDRHRDALNYHMDMDHFGVKLGDGNMFEWANDMETNDKDIVFALNPEPLLAAGADPEKAEGWSYGQVETEEDGRMVSVYRFLKPFEIQ